MRVFNGIELTQIEQIFTDFMKISANNIKDQRDQCSMWISKT